ncbi:MAG: cytochrome c oxidase subunit 3 [Saprospiraceae bacterium]|nr:cytochrome c oxidase subunit 3 [Saprospiraceae bacterium]
MTTDTHTEVSHHDHVDDSQIWEGGTSPFKASYGKLMIWYFLISDAFTFSGFLIAYGALRFSTPTWPLPDVVFSTFPGGIHHAPLIFVTVMTFILILSSVTMVRAVQEGKKENRMGVVKWMGFTIIGGLMFLSCQAWEWTNLIAKEHMSISTNPFGTHTTDGVYLNEDGTVAKTADGKDEKFTAGTTYLIHKKDGEWHKRKFKITSGEYKGQVAQESFGPKAFGALFFFITGFHGFHVFSGVVFLTIVMLNALSGLYVSRKNGYEMVEKIGLYWHFVDLVWVFVFLVFYLL